VRTLDAFVGHAPLTQPAENKYRVLLVEDEAIIAMLMEDLLEELGCDIVTTAGTLDDALTAAGTGRYDVAFLDVNLHGVPVYPVAEVLRSRAIPFAFVTGYGSTGVAAVQVEAPILQKPFQLRDLAAVLSRLRSQQSPKDT
jgi:CheY-like chemotaxis protein